MSSAQVGIALAAVLAGPPLYGMVQAGTLDATGALQRGAVVAVAAAIGASYVGRLVESYRKQAEKDRILEARTAQALQIVQELNAKVPPKGTPPGS